MQLAIDFWNAPSPEYDSLTANLMQGFAKEFGTNCHFLLLNAANLGGPELAADLDNRLDISGRIGQSIGNKLLKISNPSGWKSFMF